MSFFRRKKEVLKYPYEYAIVKLSDVAKENFIEDKHNLIIMKVKGNQVEEIEYTPEEVNALREVEGIPVIMEDLSEDFDFDQETDFGEVITSL